MIILLFATNLTAQANAWQAGEKYSNAKIKLTSGKILNVKRISVGDTLLYLSAGNPLGVKSISLNDVGQVQIATKNYLIVGGLAGTAVGLGVMLVVESIVEEPKTEYKSGPGYWSETTTTTEMASIYKILIVGAGAAAGSLIGYFIKGGYEQIYPAVEKKKGLSFNLALSSQNKIPMMAVSFKF